MMKLDTDRISPLQFMFAVALFLQSSSMLSAFFVPFTQQESWLCVALGLLVAMPLFLIFYGLMKDYPDKNLIEINEIVFGRVGGILVSIINIWFFITLTTYNLRDIGQFVKQTIMVDTPVFVIMVVCIVVCAYGVYYGLRVVTRYSLVFTFLALTIFITASLLTLNLWDLNNFKPVFSQPAINYIHGTHLITNIPFGEIVVFLMIAPGVKRGKKSMYRYLLGGLLIGGLSVLLVVTRDIAVLGNTITLFTLPPFETLRMVSITQALNRMEILFAIVLIVLLFSKIMLLYYCSVKALAQIFKLQSYRPLILVLGALLLAYSFFVHTSSLEHAAFSQEQAPALWTLFEYLLPLATLIVGRIRKLPQKNIQKGVV